MVLVLSSFLICATCFIDLWKLGAYKNDKFLSFIDSIEPSIESSKFIPNASIKSALPTLLETERFPCFATFTPKAANINDDIVDTFIEDLESPPVPHKSIISKFI